LPQSYRSRRIMPLHAHRADVGCLAATAD
jgi:hypothetical protein